MASNYYLEAGSYEDVSWGAGDISVEANPSSGAIALVGGFDSVSIDDAASGDSVSMSMLEIDADTVMTEYGFSVGDVALALESMEVVEGYQAMALGPINVASTTSLDGGRASSDLRMDMAIEGSPLGDIRYDLDMVLENIDAAALGQVIDALEQAQNNPDPTMGFEAMQDDLANLVAAGLTFRINQLDISLPQGTMLAKLDIDVAETDPSSFTWSAVVLAMEASADITIPSGLYDMMVAMNPQANAAVAMGILRPDGDNYVMEAEYKQGLLTVNGAPMPIPIPGM